MTSRPLSAPSYASEIKPLFRPKDRNAMKGHFDLWAYADVKTNADAIYNEVSGGNMPCDAPWPPERVDLFKRWMDGGMQP
jgi:hypothetical protein